MVTFLIVAWCVLCYVLIAGFAFSKTELNIERNCYRCQNPSDYVRCYRDHTLPAFFTGLFWPVALPLAVGILFGQREPKKVRTARKIEELEKEVGW